MTVVKDTPNIIIGSHRILKGKLIDITTHDEVALPRVVKGWKKIANGSYVPIEDVETVKYPATWLTLEHEDKSDVMEFAGRITGEEILGRKVCYTSTVYPEGKRTYLLEILNGSLKGERIEGTIDHLDMEELPMPTIRPSHPLYIVPPKRVLPSQGPILKDRAGLEARLRAEGKIL